MTAHQHAPLPVQVLKVGGFKSDFVSADCSIAGWSGELEMQAGDGQRYWEVDLRKGELRLRLEGWGGREELERLLGPFSNLVAHLL